MATITSTASGLASAGGTWVGGTPPVTGDIVVIANGHVVHWDTGLTTAGAGVLLGSNASGVGHALTINGASSVSFGTLVVDSGATLYLCGFDAVNNTLGLVNRYGLLSPAPGAAVLGDVASDFGSILKNNGRFEPIGSSGSRITLSVPSANVNWGVQVTNEAKTPQPMDRQGVPPLAAAVLGFVNISNAAHTGPGSFGDSSLVINSSTPSLTTEVAALAGVDATGKYFVDYDCGIVYLYASTFAGLAINTSYYHLDRLTANWRGWGVVSYGSTTYNTCLVDYCDLKYMGTVAGSASINSISRRSPLNLDGHQSAAKAGDSTRLAYVKHSTFNYCVKQVHLIAVEGTQADPILITNNTLNEASGGVSNDGISCVSAYATYVTIDSNAFNSRGIVVDLSLAYTWSSTSVITPDAAGWVVTNNTGFAGVTFVLSKGPFPSGVDPDASFGARPSSPDLYIANNDVRGCGNQSAIDGRMLRVAGTSGHPCVVESNYFHHGVRAGHLNSDYVTFRKNIFYQFFHHGFTGSEVDDTYATDLLFENNLFVSDRTGTATSSTCAAISLSYNHRTVINNVTIAGNTCDGWLYGLLDMNDIPDTAGGPTLATNIVAVDNVVANGKYAMGSASTVSLFTYAHVLECDYNVLYNQSTAMASGLGNNANATGFYQGGSKYNRLASGSRNIPGVALFDATYTTAQAARSLVYTVNTLGTDHTLAWGGGTAVQLVQDSGTSAGAGLRTLACSGKSWTSATTALRAKWLWVVSGTGAGQARAIASGTANTAYAAAVSGGGTSGWLVGQYLQSNAGSPELSKNVVVKVTAVGGGQVTAVKIISGGAFAAVPGDPVNFQRVTGSTGSGTVSLNLSWGPGLVLVPDLTTDLDATSVFAVVNSQVTLTDSGAVNTVKAGLYLPDPAAWQTAVQLPTTTQTDAGITVSVNLSPAGDPKFVTSAISTSATQYKIQTSSSAKEAGTADNAPSTDYFGQVRPQGNSFDIGFHEYGLSTRGRLVAPGPLGRNRVFVPSTGSRKPVKTLDSGGG